MKKFVLFNFLLLIVLGSFAQQNRIKNVIVMIPDGTSTSLLSVARWYQTYQNPSQSTLNIDAFVKGLVRTHSSDAPIGDSAPTTSCYMTGHPTQTGFVSTYPVKTDHDLVPVDAARAYQPVATLLEASKQLKNKSTGLVFTCEFPQATPADCAAHTYNRGAYDMIAPQMVHNNVDVVIGGGVSFLKEKEQNYLKDKGYSIYLDDYQGMRQCQKAPMWALYNPSSMPYDLERDAATTPSLAEMTQKALDLLTADPDGFFLMVEGSQVDWAAHDNDAKAAITDFFAFDQACKVAFDFAQKDQHTLVVVLPDHGTSAMTIGSAYCSHGFDKLSLQQIMEPLDDYKLSLRTMAAKLKKTDTTQWSALFQQYFNIELQTAEMEYLQMASDNDQSPQPKELRKNNLSMVKILSQIVYGRTCIGFTTFGHTGENVFFAMYHPEGKELTGVHTNVEINQYLKQQLGLADDDLDKLTAANFADYREVFAGYQCAIDSLAPYQYRLTVKNKKNTLIADSYTNIITVNKQKYELNSVMIYFPKNQTFYVPKDLAKYLLVK